MSIEAIAANYNSFSYYSYQFFGATVSAERLQLLMEKYHISQTDDAYYDMRELYRVMRSDATADANVSAMAASSNQIGQAQAISNAPWADLMQKVGLSATGILSEDFARFEAQVARLSVSTKDNPEQAKALQGIIQDARVAFVTNPSSSPASTGATGDDINMLLNSMYLI